MHVYYLICPNSIGLNYNPGVSLISYGCRYLIKQADPEAVFVPISNISYSAAEWDLLYKQADCLVLPGGSLYDPGDVSVYWNSGVWQHIKSAQDNGIPFADVFGYTSYPFPKLSVDTVTALVLKQSRTRRILAEQARAALFTPRDFLTAHIAAKAGVSAAVLPCSSFWSPAFFGIKPATRVYNAISVFPITKDKWFADALMGIAGELSKELPTWLICHTAPEYKWLTSFYPDAANIRCIFDPFSLLDFYSKVDKIVACRLHAAIPAFALGCRLSYISFDSRSFALDQFHVGHILYTDIAGGQPPDYFYSLSKASLPDPAPFIALFKTEVVSKL